MTTGKKIRLGVIGGAFGGAFPWHEHPDCVVEAVSDMNAEACAKLRGHYSCDKSYSTLEEMVQDPNVDAVAIFTGAVDHARHSVTALKAGKHVVSAVHVGLTVAECEEVLAAVEETGLTYMMAETSYWYQGCISARKFYEEGKFGSIYYTEAEYHHSGLEALYFDKEGRPTWRHGLPPMLYPTHCTAFLVGVTGERLTEVVCVGWGNDDPICKENRFNNPFWNETAFFKTDRGNALRVAIYWKGAHRGTERAQWYGDKMSFFMGHPNWNWQSVLVHEGKEKELDTGGFVRQNPELENYEQVKWYETDMLPEPLRHHTGHDGSHVFIVHEFIDSLVNGHRPAVDIYEALAYTVPGIIAHESALQGGTLLKIPQYDS